MASPLSAAMPQLLAPLNRVVMPLIRAGIGAPLLTPIGLVVMEVEGRRSGRLYSVPLIAWALFDHVVVSTVRRDSAWLKNLCATGHAAVWLRGRRREAELVGELTTPLTGVAVAVLRLT